MRASDHRRRTVLFALLGLVAGCPRGGLAPPSFLRLPAGTQRFVCTSRTERVAAPGSRHRLVVVAPPNAAPRLAWTFGDAYPTIRGTPRKDRVVRRGLWVRGQLSRTRVRFEFAGGKVSAALTAARPRLLVGKLTVTEKPPSSGPVLCWFEPLDQRFRYDPARGGCYDGGGKKGLRRLPLEVIRETRNGECVDFRASRISALPQGWRAARGWNLKGSDMGTLRLYTSGLLDAQLQGAHLEDMVLFYFCLTGKVDRYTRHHRRCQAKGSLLRCGDSCQ